VPRWGSRRWLIALGAAIVALSLVACSGVPRTARAAAKPAADRATSALIGHDGQFLTDSEGQVVTLHGLDMAYKLAPYEPAAIGFGAVAAQSLGSNGFDLVRLGVFYSAVEPRPGVFSQAYMKSIAGTVAALAHDGIYTILDFHQDQLNLGFDGDGFPSWSVDTNGLPLTKYKFPLGYVLSQSLNAAFNNIWADAPGPGNVGLQERYASAWRYVAAQFAGDPWVLGYDLINEPWQAHATDAALAAFYAKVIAAVRAVDPNHLVFYEPWLLFQFGQPTSLPALDERGLAMSFHDYCAEQAPSHPTQCAALEQVPIENALARSAATGDGLVMSEFGATADLADLRNVVALGDAARLSWAEWAYCGCGDPTSTAPGRAEGLVVNPSLPATGANVNLAKLAVLAEPYPRLISGTPTSYSFTPATRTFDLTYKTTGPGGKVFPAGSCSAVLVPALQYPAGYTVTATGARVTSLPGAGVLTLTSSGPATTVTIEITPATGGTTLPPLAQAIAGCH
jgi:endoglycosylceramidase